MILSEKLKQLREAMAEELLSEKSEEYNYAINMCIKDAEYLEELSNDLNNGRDYLMTVNPNDLTVSDALEAFGFGPPVMEWLVERCVESLM